MFRIELSILAGTTISWGSVHSQMLFEEGDWGNTSMDPRLTHSCNQREACDSHMFYDELACKCFSKIQCRIGCPEG